MKPVPAENVESFLSRSSADSGFQEHDDQYTWDSVEGEAASDSLSSFSRLSSSAEPKESRSERRNRRKELLEKQLEDESEITLSDGSEKVSGSRKLFLSPTQFLGSLTTGVLGGSKPRQQGSMERPSALSTPTGALRAKGKEAFIDVPVEAVACVVTSGVDTIQLGNQGHPQGSSSASPPLPSFNIMPPTEHAQALHRNLAAELIHAGAGRSSLLPQRIRFSQEPGTAVSMNDPFAIRRNNLNFSLQDGHSSVAIIPH